MTSSSSTSPGGALRRPHDLLALDATTSVTSIEHERKFLVRAVDTDTLATLPSLHLIQGYLRTGTPELRLRRTETTDGGVTFEYTRKGDGTLSRPESTRTETPEIGEAVLALLTQRAEKLRVTVSGWEIDVYLGALLGLVIAEAELSAADAPLPPVPSWLTLGVELTGVKAFKNASLATIQSAEAGLALRESAASLDRGFVAAGQPA